MRAMVLEAVGRPLEMQDRPTPTPGPGRVRIAVWACGVCRTDLHVVDGELAPSLPRVPGHQAVGVVDAVGEGVSAPALGERVGVPWLGETCGVCYFCASGRENLCADARFTGWQLDGGFADTLIADARACMPVPRAYSDDEAAPLLCAGLIGYRALRMAGDAHRLGIYGFGAAAHIVTQLACSEAREVYAVTRPGDTQKQVFARELGAVWAGSGQPPLELDAALIFAPDGDLVPVALRAVQRGGTVVCAGIHMSDIPSFPYALLWGERVLRSVANLTRQDGLDFLAVAPNVPIRTEVHVYPLERANEALQDLRFGRFTGAAVLRTR